jgi:GAF domain-containing protein
MVTETQVVEGTVEDLEAIVLEYLRHEYGEDYSDIEFTDSQGYCSGFIAKRVHSWERKDDDKQEGN